MEKTIHNQYESGKVSPVEYFKNKRKSNKIYGILLGLFIVFMVVLTLVV